MSPKIEVEFRSVAEFNKYLFLFFIWSVGTLSNLSISIFIMLSVAQVSTSDSVSCDWSLFLYWNIEVTVGNLSISKLQIDSTGVISGPKKLPSMWIAPSGHEKARGVGHNVFLQCIFYIFVFWFWIAPPGHEEAGSPEPNVTGSTHQPLPYHQ